MVKTYMYVFPKGIKVKGNDRSAIVHCLLIPPDEKPKVSLKPSNIKINFVDFPFLITYTKC